MADVKTAARELIRALDATNKALERYAVAAIAAGRDSPDGPTARGLDRKQLRKKLEALIVAKLSPPVRWEQRAGVPVKIDALIQLHGAPEARRYCAAHPLPGAS